MWKTANEYRGFFKRLFAQHETPPPAVCVPITPDYVQDVVSLETEEKLSERVGLRFDELAALPTEDFYAVARQKPLELIVLLQIHGLAHLTFLVFPADVTITVLGRVFGVDPVPFLALDPDEGSAAFRERIYGSAAFIEDMPAEKRSAVLSAAFCSGNFRSAVREVADVDPPFMQ